MRPRKCRTEKNVYDRWWARGEFHEVIERCWTGGEGANWLDMIGNSWDCIGIKNNITTLLDSLIVFYLVVTAKSVGIYSYTAFYKEFLFLFTFLRNHVIPLFFVASKNPFPIITVGIAAVKFRQLTRRTLPRYKCYIQFLLVHYLLKV